MTDPLVHPDQSSTGLWCPTCGEELRESDDPETLVCESCGSEHSLDALADSLCDVLDRAGSDEERQTNG